MTTTTRTPAAPAQRRRRRPRPAPPVLPPWSCENCTHVNTGRRWRCQDCGTTRE